MQCESLASGSELLTLTTSSRCLTENQTREGSTVGLGRARKEREGMRVSGLEMRGYQTRWSRASGGVIA